MGARPARRVIRAIRAIGAVGVVGVVLAAAAGTAAGAAAGAATGAATGATWVLVHRKPGIASYYLDRDSVRAHGSRRTYRVLADFDDDGRYEAARPYRSAVFVREADCARRQQDTRSFSQYHDRMAQGDATYLLSFDDDPLHWERPPSRSAAGRVLERACRVRR